MKLTAAKVKQAKPKEKDYKLSDGLGLYLLVKTNGRRYWRMKYRLYGKEKTAALGVYPEVSLAKARDGVLQARSAIKNGIDPVAHKKQEKEKKIAARDDSFESLAKEWIGINQSWSQRHSRRVINTFEKDVFPYIGHLPVTEISPPVLLKVVRRVEQRDALELASRVLQRCGSVFRYAIQSSRATLNPATELKGALKTRKVKHVASVKREDLPLLLNAINGYDGNPVTLFALQLLMLTFVRPGELRGALWKEFDMEQNLWRIPADRMKMDTDHIVPLSRQAILLIDKLKPLTGSCELVFPGERSSRKPISENTMTYALYRLGFKSRATPHGFRATASSILNEEGFSPDAIERQLSHIERNNVRAAYTHHARFLDERKRMMQWWADYLSKLTDKPT